MSNRQWAITLFAAILVLGTFKAIDVAAAGDGSVRFLSAGPVRLGDGQTAHMRMLLPAVQRAVQAHFVGEGGELLATVNVEPSPGQRGRLMELTFDATFAGPGSTRFGTMSIKDGSSNTIHSGPSNGIIAILIGLRQGTAMGTLQLIDAAGQSVGILPYIEQDNLFRLPGR